MTSFEMDAMLKSIHIKRDGCVLQIFGSAIVDGKSTAFMILRKIPAEQTPRFPPYWFEELSNFNTKGEME